MRSVALAYILWIPPMGLLGLHRFYCGRVWTGVLWLVTGGCFLIGWIVDAFILPGMVRTTNLERRVEVHEQRLAGMPPGALPAAEGHRVIYCTRCGSAMQVPVGSGGRRFHCPSCHTVIAAPA
ncbi:MAG: NINE protein [Phycisphaerales bacterium]|nr:MAG: NINE protein [Phycisphaerales bacterium]